MRLSATTCRVFTAALFTLMILTCLDIPAVQAQTMMPLPSHSSTYTGWSRGFWFTSPTDFAIYGVRVPTDASTTGNQCVLIVKLTGPPPTSTTGTTNYTVLGFWGNVAGTSVIPCYIEVNTGDFIGVLGHRQEATPADFNAVNSYGNVYNSSVLGQPVTLNRFGMQTNFMYNPSGPPPILDPVWGTTSGSIGRVEVYAGIQSTAPNDAGIASIDSPINFCAGQHDVIVTLKNYGTKQLTSANINWTLNGAPQSTYSWSGLLDTLNMTTRETQVTLASGMNFASGVPYDIVAWTTMPNGVPDTVNRNDTARVTTQAALDGVFTIGGASPDYQTLDAALTDLHAFGLCGPVVYKIRPGTYNEQIVIGGNKYGGAVPGVSSVNTITFESETGNRSDVTVTYHSQTGNPVVHINATNYVTMRNLTLSATNASNCRCLHIKGGSEHCTFENIDMISPSTTSISNVTAVVESPSGSLDHYLTFRNCSFQGGSYGLYMYGSGSTSTEDHLTVENCRFTGQYYRPWYLYYFGKSDLIDNTIEHTSTYSSKYLAYIYYCYDMNIERNSFLSSNASRCYGIYLYRNNYSMSGTTRFVNNFISIHNTTSTTYGLRPYYTEDLLAAHNTIYINSSYSSAYNVYTYSGSNHEYYNNIYYNNGNGRNWYVSSPSIITASDYNAFYTNGSVMAYWSGNRANLAALQAASGMDQHSVSKAITFKNPLIGDLHLDAPSDDDTDLFGILLPEVTIDIDHQNRVNPYRGADEACYVIPGSLTYEFVDEAGMPAGFAEVPGTIGVKYGVSFPEFASTVTFTVRFFDPVTDQLVYETTFSAPKKYGIALQGTEYLTLPSSVPPGYYRMEVMFHTKNSCDAYSEYMPYVSALLLVPEGRLPCVVWPGDANNDGIVNYSDRRDLNRYIYDANMRSSWLTGPARYQADAESNPFTYLEWKPQAAAPWYTADGCYMDTDGNGVINNLDYIAMKLNWSSMTPWYGGSPKPDGGLPSSFSMDQNYPNPFNPRTVIRYHAPESCHARLIVTDALGRTVAVLVDGRVDSGLHETAFDGTGLPNGTYIATIIMTGDASGVTFTKTVKMALAR